MLEVRTCSANNEIFCKFPTYACRPFVAFPVQPLLQSRCVAIASCNIVNMTLRDPFMWTRDHFSLPSLLGDNLHCCAATRSRRPPLSFQTFRRIARGRAEPTCCIAARGRPTFRFVLVFVCSFCFCSMNTTACHVQCCIAGLCVVVVLGAEREQWLPPPGIIVLYCIIGRSLCQVRTN